VRRLRILHVVTHSQRRGAEVAALDLAEELEGLGHQNSVVALTPAFDGGCEAGLPALSRRDGGRGSLVQSVWRLRRLLREKPVDVVLAHGGRPAQVAALSKRGRSPFVVWQRILDFPTDFWSSYHRHWWAFLLRRIDAAFALTPELAAELERLGFDGPVWLAPNSRRPAQFLAVDRDDAGARLRAELGLDAAVPIIGFVGALVEQKSPERALDVLEGVHAAGRRAHLVVGGDGPLRPQLESAVQLRALDGDVTFLGHRRDIEQVLGAIDLLLITSDVEGIPGVAIEAQMAGCPVVTFALGRVADVVAHGATGVVIDGHDVDAMTASVAQLLGDAGARNAMALRARERSVEFSTDRVAQEYAARLTGLVEPVTPAPAATTGGRPA
jgi:glycosyltransferase involved in cell wall biosynthesis